MIFGSSSEKRKLTGLASGHAHQLHLFLADLVADAERIAQKPGVSGNVEVKHPDPRKTQKKGRRAKFPEHLPEVTTTFELPKEQRVCRCGAELHQLGFEESRELECVEVVVVHNRKRAKYACRSCEEGALVHYSMLSRPRQARFSCARPRAAETSSMNSRVHPNYKTKYRVTNWSEYDQALTQRGNITVWFSQKAIAGWNGKPSGSLREAFGKPSGSLREAFGKPSGSLREAEVRRTSTRTSPSKRLLRCVSCSACRCAKPKAS